MSILSIEVICVAASSVQQQSGFEALSQNEGPKLGRDPDFVYHLGVWAYGFVVSLVL